MAKSRKGTILQMVPKSQQAEETHDDGPERILLDLLERIRAGTFQPSALVIHCLYPDPNVPGLSRHAYWSTGTRPLEHLGLLDVARQTLLTEGH